MLFSDVYILPNLQEVRLQLNLLTKSYSRYPEEIRCGSSILSVWLESESSWAWWTPSRSCICWSRRLLIPGWTLAWCMSHWWFDLVSGHLPVNSPSTKIRQVQVRPWLFSRSVCRHILYIENSLISFLSIVLASGVLYRCRALDSHRTNMFPNQRARHDRKFYSIPRLCPKLNPTSPDCGFHANPTIYRLAYKEDQSILRNTWYYISTCRRFLWWVVNPSIGLQLIRLLISRGNLDIDYCDSNSTICEETWASFSCPSLARHCCGCRYFDYCRPYKKLSKIPLFKSRNEKSLTSILV